MESLINNYYNVIIEIYDHILKRFDEIYKLNGLEKIKREIILIECHCLIEYIDRMSKDIFILSDDKELKDNLEKILFQLMEDYIFYKTGKIEEFNFKSILPKNI